MINLTHKKVRLFTHNDLDGYANYIILRCYFKKENIFVEYCTYDNIDNRISHFMNTITEKVDYMFITDIAIKDETIADKLEICDILFDDVNVKLLDHHKSALFLNKYNFARVLESKDDELICGSMLLYLYLVEDLGFPRNEILETWLKYVNDYDTWLWEDKYHYELPKNWNELFFLYDKNMFINNVLDKILKKKDLSFSKTDKLLLDIEHGKQNAYIKSRIKGVIEKKIYGYNCAIVFAEQYINELSTALAENYPNCQIQIVINGKNISYRVRDKNLNIDLNEFAGHFGGGGHQYAAGSKIPDEAKDIYLNLIFKEKDIG